MPTTGLFTAVWVVVSTMTASPAFGQRLSFERSFPSGAITLLDVSTERGRVEVTAGASDRIEVTGTVTVRVGWNVPANAMELARAVGDRPPVELAGSTVRLRPPVEADQRRAVTVSYQVRVPRGMRLSATSDSGAIAVDGIAAPVVIRTQSGAIDLARLGDKTEVVTGSGAVNVRGVSGPLHVETASSAITATDLGGELHARTTSGAVQATFIGPGDVDVQTASSAITLRGVGGALVASTNSGRTAVTGSPNASWRISSGSGSIDVEVEPGARMSVDAVSGSGSVRLDGAHVDGTTEMRRVVGRVGGGGPLVQLRTRSAAIHVVVGSHR